MPNVAIDASSLVGALLTPGSTPERAFLRALEVDVVCLSIPVEQEIRSVFERPKFKHVSGQRREMLLEAILRGARWFGPSVAVVDCRDAKDNKYLELALAAAAHCIISSDADLLDLHPWRGIPILSPAAYPAWRG